jgi:lipid-A-disaccharide synthase-like uncharacterized protein
LQARGEREKTEDPSAGVRLHQDLDGQAGKTTIESWRKMHMSAVFEIMGTTGSFIICASAIPQVVKTCRIKRSRDFSIAYLGALMLGISLLQSYSLYVRDVVFIIGNTLSMLSTGLLIVLWFRYGARGKRQEAKTITKS